MTQEKLNNITYWIKENIVQNSNIMFENIVRGINDEGNDINEDQPIDLVEVITSLHNELYKEVTGRYYDYYFHWANHLGSNVDDALFKEADDYTKIPTPNENDIKYEVLYDSTKDSPTTVTLYSVNHKEV